MTGCDSHRHWGESASWNNRTTRKLNCTIGNHFIRIPVRLRAGAGLEDDQRKLVIPPAVDHFLRREQLFRPFPLEVDPARHWPGWHIRPAS
jgi:hypothetical protein